MYLKVKVVNWVVLHCNDGSLLKPSFDKGLSLDIPLLCITTNTSQYLIWRQRQRLNRLPVANQLHPE